jgi:hypothetical protein
VDTLIAESNAGSLRWMYGFEQMPVSSQRIRDGELYEYLLPVRGYTLEDLEKNKQEKLQKEKEKQELREEAEREKAERLKSNSEGVSVHENLNLEEEPNDESEADNDEKRGSAPGIIANTKTSLPLVESASMAREGSTVKPTIASLPAPSVNSARRDLFTTATAVSGEETAADQEVTIHTVTSLGSGVAVSLAEPDTMTSGSTTTQSTTRRMTKISSKASSLAKVSNDALQNLEAPVDDAVETAVDADDDRGIDLLQAMTRAQDTVGGVKNDDGDVTSNLPKPEVDMQELDPPPVLDFDAFAGLPWFDEVDANGQEVRLSQMLADEEWQPSATESAQAAELLAVDEVLETESIMMASRETELTAAKTTGKSSTSPSYDQTKLDGISQLWGLPPDDADYLPFPTAVLDEEEAFDGIGQLWGAPFEPIQSKEIPTIASSDPDSDGYTIKASEGVATSSASLKFSQSDEDVYGQNNLFDEDIMDDSVYDGFEWHEDGLGERLSQMLADESWESADDAAPDERIKSLEDYAKKVVEILEAAEDEILETEAILRAPPGASSLAILERDGAAEILLQPINETRLADLKESSDDEVTSDYDDLDALLMDVEWTRNSTKASGNDTSSKEAGLLEALSTKDAETEQNGDATNDLDAASLKGNVSEVEETLRRNNLSVDSI